MAMTTFSLRMEEELKNEFDKLCNQFGMNASIAFNIFARAVVRERRIPFEIYAPSEEITSDEALKLLEEVRKKAYKDGLSNMSLDEINAEIDAARKERSQKNKEFKK